MIYEDCGHRRIDGTCELLMTFCNSNNAKKACYESETMVKLAFGKTAKEKGTDEEPDILRKLRNRYKVYQLSYADQTTDAKLIKEAIDELVRLYAELNG